MYFTDHKPRKRKGKGKGRGADEGSGLRFGRRFGALGPQTSGRGVGRGPAQPRARGAHVFVCGKGGERGAGGAGGASQAQWLRGHGASAARGATSRGAGPAGGAE